MFELLRGKFVQFWKPRMQATGVAADERPGHAGASYWTAAAIFTISAIHHAIRSNACT
jgi:hypothetical protein